MAKITREEVLKIAKMSQLAIHEDEIPAYIKQLEQVLSYAERVKEIAAEVEEPSNRNVNTFRQDVVDKTDPEPILDQAPVREGDYFVVPVILESN